jgi:hypothetical protein
VATVWDNAMIMIGPPEDMRSRIHEKINEMVTGFAAEYYRQNPH